VLDVSGPQVRLDRNRHNVDSLSVNVPEQGLDKLEMVTRWMLLRPSPEAQKPSCRANPPNASPTESTSPAQIIRSERLALERIGRQHAQIVPSGIKHEFFTPQKE